MDLTTADQQLFAAARIGSLADVDAAIAAGARINARDPRDHYRTPLQIAADYGQASVARLLIQQRDIDFLIRDADGRTARQIAAGWGFAEILTLLREAERKQMHAAPDPKATQAADAKHLNLVLRIDGDVASAHLPLEQARLAVARSRTQLVDWLEAQPEEQVVNSVVRPPENAQLATPVFSVFAATAVADRLLDPQRRPQFVQSAEPHVRLIPSSQQTHAEDAAVRKANRWRESGG